MLVHVIHISVITYAITFLGHAIIFLISSYIKKKPKATCKGVKDMPTTVSLQFLLNSWKLAKHEQLNISAFLKISKKETMDFVT